MNGWLTVILALVVASVSGFAVGWVTYVVLVRTTHWLLDWVARGRAGRPEKS